MSTFQRSNEGALPKITASYMEYFQTNCSALPTSIKKNHKQITFYFIFLKRMFGYMNINPQARIVVHE